ncbi:MULTISPECIES: hypothetical protein [unclassified Streptomyces]|uniref:Uncharacterized protein n=1 Tax=Streptomyces sp. NBC_00060 TaxID=2975636 RepID=A0AAU2GZD2_9ACTN
MSETGMSGKDRRKIWIKLIVVVGAVALAVIAIFKVTPNHVGRDNNNCHSSVCGDHNKDNKIQGPETAK